jgi:hypothetical protein
MGTVIGVVAIVTRQVVSDRRRTHGQFIVTSVTIVSGVGFPHDGTGTWLGSGDDGSPG